MLKSQIPTIATTANITSNPNTHYIIECSTPNISLVFDDEHTARVVTAQLKQDFPFATVRLFENTLLVNDMLAGGHVTSNANNNAGNVIGNGQDNGVYHE